MKKRITFLTATAILVVLAGIIFWRVKCSYTHIAFVNYQITTLGEIAKSNTNKHIKLAEVSVEDIKKLKKYDMVFVNGMGLRITADQRETMEEVSEKVPVLTTAATNPDNYIVSLDSLTVDTLTQYLNNGGRRNFRSMLNYVRRNIDKKILFNGHIESVVLASRDLLYHIDPKHPEDEELGFNSIAEYNNFLKDNGLYHEDYPRIIITGQMGEPKDLIAKLEETGNMVYPVRNLRTLIMGMHADSIRPSAVINMAHGRMGDFITQYLKNQNIPLFTTLYVPQLTEDWENDKNGMSGGFLSQSVVTPEIDGAIRPYVVFAHRKTGEGLQEVYAIPERLKTFVQTVNNYIQLQKKPNSEKRIVVFYFKGPGQNALTASGMQVVPSLYNFLQRLKAEGYKVENLPESSDVLGKMIQKQGAVLGTYAEGAFTEFMKNGKPALINKEQYEKWISESIRPEMYKEIVETSGEFPGNYMVSEDGRLGVARLQFGNVVLMPQPMAGAGENAFKIVHGTHTAPPHTYVAAYLWAQHGFKADAMIHFGTHGSLEFTPDKQVALCDNDWSDRLVGALPHFYIYTISNVGEAMTAKRRSYAGIQSYLTPPFMESDVRGQYRELSEAVKTYFHTLENGNENRQRQAALEVKIITVQMGIHRALELDSNLTSAYTEDDIVRIDNFAEELANEKITGKLYIMGKSYDTKDINSSIYAMCTDPIAYSLLALDKQRGKATDDVEKHKSLFTTRYLNHAKQLVSQLLAQAVAPSDAQVCKIAGITSDELTKAREIAESQQPMDMLSMMMSMAQEVPNAGNMHAGGPSAQRDDNSENVSKMKKMMRRMGKNMNPERALKMSKMMGASPEALKKMEAAMKKKSQPSDKQVMAKPTLENPEYSPEEVRWAMAVTEVERTVKNVSQYRTLLLESPEYEMRSLLNALNGGYTEPSPGGDPIVNPNTLPSGRNLFGVNAENTPSESAWEKGKLLADQTIAQYRTRHNDSIPRKVSYTLWSGEFVETEGATIAQVLYMLGVEPVRDAFGRVTDLRLIPSKELGRPRIDVVVQTSGQLRDIAASRLHLISQAVSMAADASDDQYENWVATGVVESEKTLINKGVSPKEAREMSHYRVFGGINGGYGTGIQAMVQASDRWEKEQEIAEAYINNMGAYYGDDENWESMREYAFEAALTNTDAVVQPRQSNTWGALSLDHVYEFMGGMDLAVRNVTGKDPDAYLSDYRNRNNARMQEVKEAINVESRTTLFNPKYITEKMNGDASDAAVFSELVQNTYGWNVMKPKAVDNEMWDEIYNVYVKDEYNMGMKEYFGSKNPAALQEITAVMMESARKGMWKASAQQLQDVARLHTEMVNLYQPACSGFVCDNAKLRQYIAQNVDPKTAQEYNQNIDRIRESSTRANKKGMVMKKETLNETSSKKHIINNVLVTVGVLAAVAALVLMVRRRRKNAEE